MSLSIPANRTDRDSVELIAREARIPIVFLPDELHQQIYPGAQAFFDFAGGVLDEIARNYLDLQWWVSKEGLMMAFVDGEENKAIRRKSKAAPRAPAD